MQSNRVNLSIGEIIQVMNPYIEDFILHLSANKHHVLLTLSLMCLRQCWIWMLYTSQIEEDIEMMTLLEAAHKVRICSLSR